MLVKPLQARYQNSAMTPLEDYYWLPEAWGYWDGGHASSLGVVRDRNITYL